MAQDVQNTSSNDSQLQHSQNGQMAPDNRNQGSVHIEQERAIAEAQGQLTLAKRFPRDLSRAHAELMQSCKIQALAGVAFYSVPRAGGHVTGPTIRLAEEIARCYGNFQYGHRELSRTEADGDRPGKSEVEVYAWDMEQNNRSIRQITVMHTIDTKSGPRRLRDQKDIDDRIANVAAKQIRGRVLALMPKWMVQAAIEECEKTLSGDQSEPIESRVRRMTSAFANLGITTKHLENYLGHSLDETTGDDLKDLYGVYNAIKEGTPASEFFAADKDEAGDEINESINQKAKPAQSKSKPKSQSKQKPQQNKPDKAPEPESDDTSNAEKSAQPEPEKPAEPEQPAETAESDEDDIF